MSIETPRRPYRARHRRLARHRRGAGAATRRKPARMSSRSRARSAAWKSSTTRSRPPAASATLVPLDMKDIDGIARLALALNERYGRLDVLVGNAGLLGHAVAARPYRAEGLGRRDGGQRHRQLAAHPLHGRAAASVAIAGRAVFLTSALAYWRAPIGAPTPPPRRRSTRWCAPTRPNARPPMCGPICSAPARRARACI